VSTVAACRTAAGVSLDSAAASRTSAGRALVLVIFSAPRKP
jgi:hypothetical protein